MNPELQARLRDELQADRGSVLDELRSYGADPYSEKVDRPSGIDAGHADSAQATAARTDLLASVDTARDRLAAIETALARMDEGSYGRCEVCGEPIPEARMEARPTSVRDVAHA